MTAVEPTALLPALPVLPAPARPAAVAERMDWRTPVRTGLWTGLALAFVTVCVVGGMPTDRVVLLGWAVGGLVAHAAVDFLAAVTAGAPWRASPGRTPCPGGRRPCTADPRAGRGAPQGGRKREPIGSALARLLARA